MQKTVILTRGASGSGKTEFANFLSNLYVDATICCADDYHMVDGEYVWKPENMGKAHQYCKDVFLEALRDNDPLIIVANTNTNYNKECKYYHETALEWGYQVFFVVLENRHGGVNSHGVPEHVLDRQEANIRNGLKLR